MEVAMETTMNVINMSGNDQAHVHEFLGSTHLAEAGEDRHNHRFAGVTEEAIPIGNGRHVHNFRSNTDFFENHFHMVKGRTGPNIELPDGKHIHFEEAVTTVNDGHRHEFEFATLIGPSPITD
jgi:hypothetical protein